MVVSVDLDTVATIVAMAAIVGSSHALLWRQLRETNDNVRRLDDRIYQLATGLKPLVEQAQQADRSP